MTAIARCRAIAAFSEEPGVITRTFLSGAMRDCLTYLMAWAKESGLSDAGVDAAGNFRALIRGRSERRLIIGSHIDSVPNAGAFDGVLGVVLGMIIAESLAGTLDCTLEVVGFSEEEGVRFRKPFIGSTAFVSGLNNKFLHLTDSNGVSVKDAISSFGLDVESVKQPLMTEAAGYLEIHIEQGPVLESLGLPLGVVEAVAGQTRAEIIFKGKANHAGTTPMHLRRDALCAASEFTLFVERMAQQTEGLIATVGQLKVLPGAGNVVPGSAVLSLEVRHARDDVRMESAERLFEEGRMLAERRGVEFSAAISLDQHAVRMDKGMVARLEAALTATRGMVHRMSSGAGHDAMIVAPRVPSAMLFLRSPGGISHHPGETVLAEDVEKALAAGRYFAENFN